MSPLEKVNSKNYNILSCTEYNWTLTKVSTEILVHVFVSAIDEWRFLKIVIWDHRCPSAEALSFIPPKFLNPLMMMWTVVGENTKSLSEVL